MASEDQFLTLTAVGEQRFMTVIKEMPDSFLDETYFRSEANLTLLDSIPEGVTFPAMSWS